MLPSPAVPTIRPGAPSGFDGSRPRIHPPPGKSSSAVCGTGGFAACDRSWRLPSARNRTARRSSPCGETFRRRGHGSCRPVLGHCQGSLRPGRQGWCFRPDPFRSRTLLFSSDSVHPLRSLLAGPPWQTPSTQMGPSHQHGTSALLDGMGRQTDEVARPAGAETV
jgi:hypothetical protein